MIFKNAVSALKKGLQQGKLNTNKLHKLCEDCIEIIQNEDSIEENSKFLVLLRTLKTAETTPKALKLIAQYEKEEHLKQYNKAHIRRTILLVGLTANTVVIEDWGMQVAIAALSCFMAYCCSGLSAQHNPKALACFLVLILAPIAEPLFKTLCDTEAAQPVEWEQCERFQNSTW